MTTKDSEAKLEYGAPYVSRPEIMKILSDYFQQFRDGEISAEEAMSNAAIDIMSVETHDGFFNLDGFDGFD